MTNNETDIRKNMKITKYVTMISLILSLLVNDSTVQASDSKIENFDVNDSQSGGYFKVGLGYRSETSPYQTEQSEIAVSLEGRYQWKNGLFVELPGVSNQLSPGINFGYNFYTFDNWNFDFVANKSHGDIDYGVVDGEQSIEIERAGSVRAGARATGNYGSNTVQLIVTPYAFDNDFDDGLYASLWVAKEWQISNWNVHASAGVQYRSEDILDYYYGISESIATENTSAYKAGSGINTTFQFGFDYPLTKNWVFESSVRHTKLSKSITNSPIISNALKFDSSRSDDITEVTVLLSYVF